MPAMPCRCGRRGISTDEARVSASTAPTVDRRPSDTGQSHDLGFSIRYGRQYGGANVEVSGAMVHCTAPAGDQASTQLAPLHIIPTENLWIGSLAADGPARVRLVSPDAQGLAAVLGIKLPAGQTSFEYVIDQYPQLPGSEARTWLESTFVIDYTDFPCFGS